MGLLEKTENNIRRFDLIPDGSRVLLAISGGVDSMVLFDLLRRLSSPHKWTLTAAHFNHQLRGDASDEDERFVGDACRHLNIPFRSARADVPRAAVERKVSIEMAARDLRHAFLAETAQALEISTVVLAHHADDQVETFWLRLLRGDVGAGFSGMRWKRRSPASSQIELVRPLLNIAKSEIIEYARTQGIQFREDASNLQPLFQRNRLRLELLPRLENFQPQLRPITLRIAEVLAAEKDFLRESAERWLEKEHSPYNLLHPALQREILRLQLLELHARPTFELIDELRESCAKPVTIAPDFALFRDESGRIRTVSPAITQFSDGEKLLSIATAGQETWDGFEITWSLVSQRGEPAAGTEYFDANRIGSAVRLRFWRPGDRFCPIGMNRFAKLQDLFTNSKIPSDERRRRVIAAATSGEIFWVEGLRIGENFKVTSTTQQILQWNWRRVNS